MTDEEREATPAYISRCRKCNRVTGATVDDNSHLEDIAKFVADEIRAGGIIERTTVGDARSLFGTYAVCTCRVTA